MDKTTLRRLARELLPKMPALIAADAERIPVERALMDALASPEGQDGPLLDALSAHPATRAWIREHGASDDVVRGLPGNPTTPLGLYYVCPEYDEDLLLYNSPTQPPRCPVHGLEMRLERD
jgi:hypothetical protein